MLNRPHTEFVQAQRLPWRRVPPGAARPDAEYKYLSRDPEDGACSCLIRYSAGWAREADESLGAAEEFYVLEGSPSTATFLTWKRDIYIPHCESIGCSARPCRYSLPHKVVMAG